MRYFVIFRGSINEKSDFKNPTNDKIIFGGTRDTNDNQYPR